MDPAGKTALVTGAGQRIGRAVALALAEAGCRVAVHYNSSEEAAAETVQTIRAMQGEGASYRADLANAGDCARLIATVRDELGPVQVLINNASMFSRGTLAETTVELWDAYFAVNVRAPWLLAQAMAAGLPQGEAGKVINLGDWRTARKNRFAYGASKAALSGLTRSLAYALAPSIQVNELALGAILPPADSSPDAPRTQDRDAGAIPAGRMGTLNEVAQAVVSLIRNDYITGQRLYVDGGRHVF